MSGLSQGAPPSSPSVAAAITTLRAAHGLCAAAQRAADDLVDSLSHLADELIEAAASEVVALWRQKRTAPNPVAEACGALLRQTIAAHTAKVLHVLEVLRQQLEAALRQGQQTVAAIEIDGEPLPQPSGGPLFDAAATIRALDLQPPTLLRMLTAPVLLHATRARLQAQWRGPLREFLDDYSRRLRQWLRRSVSELCNGFHARAAPVLAQLEARTAAPGTDNSAEMGTDLRRLREFAAAANSP